MLNLNFVTLKRHFLARNRVIWAIARQNQFSRFSCRGRQEKRKGKGREGTKSHASVIFHLFVGKPSVNGLSPNFAHQVICWT